MLHTQSPLLIITLLKLLSFSSFNHVDTYKSHWFLCQTQFYYIICLFPVKELIADCVRDSLSNPDTEHHQTPGINRLSLLQSWGVYTSSLWLNFPDYSWCYWYFDFLSVKYLIFISLYRNYKNYFSSKYVKVFTFHMLSFIVSRIAFYGSHKVEI
jgi:hypothetical protein